MATINNSQYFKQEAGAGQISRRVNLSPEILEAVKSATAKLQALGFATTANEMNTLYRLASAKDFTVAVVGEFSRGKSTLINRLLGAPVLPEGNLPTTAMLTRIVYGAQPTLTLRRKGVDPKPVALTPEAWQGLTANNFGADDEAQGLVKVTYPCRWLGEYGITIIDTPGAGDLDSHRAKQIERALITTDGAIIAIDATRALSLTERLFIEHKITSRGVPFMAVAVTKLDLISEQEGAEVIAYVSNRLSEMGLYVPVVDAANVDALKKIMVGWMANPRRRELLDSWLRINARAIAETARAFLQQEQQIINAKDAEKEELIRQRNSALMELHQNWETLRKEMESRCTKCYEAFMAAANEAGENMTETLCHEADRQQHPKDWLEKEYAYRTKRELSAISASLDNLVAKRLANDVRWLNGELNKQFKTLVGGEIESFKAKDDFQPTVDDGALKLENLKNKSIKATVATSALTIGAVLMLGGAGAPLILATMGVGTSTNILSRMLIEKTGARQREELKRLISKQVPELIAQSSAGSRTRIKIIYNNVIAESHSCESRWMDTQRELIRTSAQNVTADDQAKLNDKIEKLNQIISSLN